jgi:hypothetical protein
MSQKGFMAKKISQGGNLATAKAQRNPHGFLNILQSVKRPQRENHLGPP